MTITTRREETFFVTGKRLGMEVKVPEDDGCVVSLESRHGSARLYGTVELLEAIEMLTKARDIILKPAPAPTRTSVGLDF